MVWAGGAENTAPLRSSQQKPDKLHEGERTATFPAPRLSLPPQSSSCLLPLTPPPQPSSPAFLKHMGHALRVSVCVLRCQENGGTSFDWLRVRLRSKWGRPGSHLCGGNLHLPTPEPGGVWVLRPGWEWMVSRTRGCRGCGDEGCA